MLAGNRSLESNPQAQRMSAFILWIGCPANNAAGGECDKFDTQEDY
jgi:hypothetical protein